LSTRASPASDLQRLVRFGVVGAANTGLGFLAIVCALAAGYGDFLANAFGYAVGVGLGYVLNSRWTFPAGALRDRAMLARYAGVAVGAYGANLAIIGTARAFGIVDNPFSHLAGMGVYTALFYLGAARVVFVPRHELDANVSALRSILAHSWPQWTAGALWLTAFASLQAITLSHDVVWQLWIARQLLGGTELYRQILEINPPLWFWTALPVQWISERLAIPADHTMTGAVFVLIGAALVLLAALSAHERAITRALILAGALLALIVVPLPDFAQREHLSLIGALPYAALIARRAEGRHTPWAVALAVGLLAAPGFALKHYFVLVPVFLELWLAVTLRRRWTVARPEIGVLAAGALIYAAALIALCPEYFTTMVPLVAVAYDGYEVQFIRQISPVWCIVWALCSVVLWRQRNRMTPLTVAAILAAAAFCCSYFAQQKGWRYHALPVTGALVFALVPLLARQRWAHAQWVVGFSVFFVISLTLLPSIVTGPYRNPREQAVNELLSAARPGDAAVMLTANPSNVWPMIEQKGLKWPSRHFTFWMIHAISAAQRSADVLPENLLRVARDVQRQTAEDLACNPPELILVDDLSTSKSPGFDLVAFFSQDADFAALFAHYSEIGAAGTYTSYRRAQGWMPERPADCRAIY